jgi:hypothetical protein
MKYESSFVLYNSKFFFLLQHTSYRVPATENVEIGFGNGFKVLVQNGFGSNWFQLVHHGSAPNGFKRA